MVRKILKSVGSDLSTLIGNATVLRRLDPKSFVDSSVGLPTVTDILSELEKPGRDPRPAFTTATFADGVETLADLRPGMVLEGQVTNVAAFGAFVDIGVHQDGLVHVSAMSATFVKDPRDVVKSGDVVRVKVLEVDIPRKRISLTLRLDDEVTGSPSVRGGQSRQDGRPPRPDRPAQPDRSTRSAQPAQPNRGQPNRPSPPTRGRPDRDAPANTALADALRRAGLTPS